MNAPQGTLFAAPGLNPVWLPASTPVRWTLDPVEPETTCGVHAEAGGRSYCVAVGVTRADAERLRLSAARALARGDREWTPERTGERTSTDAEVVARALQAYERAGVPCDEFDDDERDIIRIALEHVLGDRVKESL